MSLQKMREEAGVTQRELADHLGVHVQCVSNWERGSSSMPQKYISKAAELLNVQVVDLEFERFCNTIIRRHTGIGTGVLALFAMKFGKIYGEEKSHGK